MIIYVDDILINGRNQEDIDNFIDRMKAKDVTLHKEGIAEGYAVVDIQQDGNKVMFTQIGLTKCIFEALGLDSKFTTVVAILAE